MDKNLGLVFHIIHGSFVDGFGTRTTVFLQGCPLRCVWCCNPEGQVGGHPEIKFTASLCNGCSKCVAVCPVQAITADPESGDNKVRIDRAVCNNCGECIKVCYMGALEYFGKYMTVDELFNILRKDEAYYRASGGGVTIGGGEPTFQPLFTYALIEKCHENYIHTAVDTCGYVVTDEGFRCLEAADLILFDLKGMDPNAHLKHTGVSNEIILKNLKKLDAMRKPIIIRVPLIPGYTDSVENVTATAEYISGLKSVVRVDLLAYHAYGGIKYEQLGREYKLQHLQALSEQQVNDIMAIFQRHVSNVQLGG